MKSKAGKTTISVMLAVPNTPEAVRWYEQALGASLLWSLGSVAGLEIGGAPFFLHEPTRNGFNCPKELGATTTRVEVFVDEPDLLIARAVKAGATGGDIRNYDAPWEKHRQGGFIDRFGHHWSVGDNSALKRFRDKSRNR